MYDENFPGGAGVVTPSKPHPPYEQLFPLPTPCFKMFWKDPLMTPTPHHFSSNTFHCYPPPHSPPLPLKNFDHTLALSPQSYCYLHIVSVGPAHYYENFIKFKRFNHIRLECRGSNKRKVQTNSEQRYYIFDRNPHKSRFKNKSTRLYSFTKYKGIKIQK